MPNLGFSGRVAGAFISSKTTPLLMLVSLALGLFAVIATPREEEPTITLPTADVTVAYPGAGSSEVDRLVARPLAAAIREIPAVKHVVSAAEADGARISVEFHGGTDRESALTLLEDKITVHQPALPPGAGQPRLELFGTEDVPVLVLVLWAEDADSHGLRRLAAEMAAEIEELPDVSAARLLGGPRRAIRVRPDPARLANHGLSPADLVEVIGAANRRLPAGILEGPGGVRRVEAGAELHRAAEVAQIAVAAGPDGPIRLGDVATVEDGPVEPQNHVLHGGRTTDGVLQPAVSIAITKPLGANAAAVNTAVLARVAALRGSLIPDDVHVEVTRNAGETATHRVNSLLEHMLIATVVVVALVALALGRREAAILALVIPVTLALVPFIYFLAGYSLNRITLAAMIFAIGILVDDAIVVIENIHRHFRLSSGKPIATALTAVDEVGNPTILATFIIVAALVPTAFVGGMSGEYLRPLPIGAAVAMLYSLVVALTVTPYLAHRLLHRHPTVEADTGPARPSLADRLAVGYRGLLAWFLDHPGWRLALYVLALLLFLAALALVQAREAKIKFLPHGDVDEFAVLIDLPAGASLTGTASAASEAAAYLGTLPEVEGYQVFVGAGAPPTFQGIARRSMSRSAPHQAEIQVRLAPASTRARESHELAEAIRPDLTALLLRYGARFSVAELPPGPPVQATVVAEVYGPDLETQMALAAELRDLFVAMPGVVDVDWSAKPTMPRLRVEVDHDRAALHGLSAAAIARTVRVAIAGEQAGLARVPYEREPVPILVRLHEAERMSAADLSRLYVPTPAGRVVPVSEVAWIEEETGEPIIFRKDLRRVVFVTGETVAPSAGPVYAAHDLSAALAAEVAARDVPMEIAWVVPSVDPNSAALQWAGEWTTTYELFRDLGVAFAAVLVLIYLMLVGWFGSFLIPLLLMLPVPLTLIGVLPAHAASGILFSGTGLIGVIALAGIMVRNSILLMDFMRAAMANGQSVRDATLEAGAVRMRPILLTASTVILGDGILLFDPLLEGLGLTLISGALVSTGLTLLLGPLIYHDAQR